MRKPFFVSVLALFLLLTCAAGDADNRRGYGPAEAGWEATGPAYSAGDTINQETDGVLSTQEAVVDDGQVLTLKAIGRQLWETKYGVREIHVYDGETLIQVLLAQEAISAEWDTQGLGEIAQTYTECWSPDKVMLVADMNFDGNGDIGLFGWAPNNSIPYYYWLWDSDAGQYRYAFCLQGAEANPETQEISSWYKYENGVYYTDYYRFDEDGALQFVRRDVER